MSTARGGLLGMPLLESLARYMGVDLRGRQVAVSEQHLHDPHIGALVEQVRGESVPHGVRGEFVRNASLACVTLDDVPERLPGHSIPPARRKKVIRLALEQDFIAHAAAV